MKREFLVPLILGAVVAVALGFLTAPGEPVPEPEVRLDAVFGEVLVHSNRTSHVLVVDRGTGPANVTVADTLGTREVSLRWNGSRATLVPITGPGIVRDGDNVLTTARAATGPGLFDNGTRIKATIYVFDEVGLLVATNGPLHERNRFEPSGDFAEIGNPWWHMGEGEAPNGTVALPFFGPEIRAALGGLPIGGAAAAYVPDHPYAWATGPVHITARIDAIG